MRNTYISKLFKGGIEKKIIKERSGYRYNSFPKIFAKLPTMFGNLWQALRDRRHSLESLKGFERSLEVLEKCLNTFDYLRKALCEIKKIKIALDEFLMTLIMLIFGHFFFKYCASWQSSTL